ncbi:hypothetical protein ACS0TY_009131 [Phlomoides rotata]
MFTFSHVFELVRKAENVLTFSAGHLLEKRNPGITNYPICYLPPYAAFIALANWEFILFFQCLLRLYQRNWLMKQDSGAAAWSAAGAAARAAAAATAC